MDELYSIAAKLKEAEQEFARLELAFKRVGNIRHPVQLSFTHSYPAQMDGGDASRQGRVELILEDDEIRHLMAARFLAAWAKVVALTGQLKKAEMQWAAALGSEKT